MYNHRIIPEGTTECKCGELYKFANYHKSGTIPITSEWTAEQAVEILKMPKDKLDRIHREYNNYIYQTGTEGYNFSDCLSELIFLELSGLTVEEIQKLSEVKK